MNDTDEALGKIAHGTVLAFVGIFISKLLGYAYRLIAARFGAEQYGILSLGLALFNVLTLVGVLGLNQGVLRYVSFYREKGNLAKVKGIIFSSVGMAGVASLFLAALLFFFADKIAVMFFHEPSLGLILKILAFTIPLDTVKNIFLSAIRAFQTVKYEIYIRNIVETGVKVLLTLGLLYAGYKTFGAVVAFSVAIAVSFVMSGYYVFKIAKIAKQKERTHFFDKELLMYSLPLVLHNLTILVLLWADTLIIGYFRTSAEVGVYNAAGPSAALMYLFPQALLSLFIPVLTGLYAKNKMEDFKKVFQTVTKWILVINIAMLGLFALSAKEFLHVFFGNEYISGWLVLIILALGYMIYYLALIGTNVLLIYEKTRTIFYISLSGALMNLGLNVFLVQKWGIVGAAIATAIAYIFMSILILRINFKLTRVRVFFNRVSMKIIGIGIVAGVITFAITFSLKLHPLLLMIVRSGIFSIIYGILTLYLGVIKDHDVVGINELKKVTKVNISFIEKIIKKFMR